MVGPPTEVGEDRRSEDERFADLVLRNPKCRLAFQTIMRAGVSITAYKVAKTTELTRPFVTHCISNWLDAGYVSYDDPEFVGIAAEKKKAIAKPVLASKLGFALFEKHSCFFA